MNPARSLPSAPEGQQLGARALLYSCPGGCALEPRDGAARRTAGSSHPGRDAAAGLLSVEELGARVADGQLETVVVVFPDLYGRLVGKRFDAGFFLAEGVHHGTHACDYLLTVDMELEPVQGYRFASWEKGYGDVRLVPDLATLRVADWLERTAIVLCDVVASGDDQAVEVAPRSVLRRALERASAAGFRVMAASELEHYLFRDSYRDAARRGYDALEPAGWYLEDYQSLQGTRTEPFHAQARRHLRRSGIPVETSKGEWGLGQHELNVRFAEALEMADRHALFKQCLKETAERMGLAVTFMAKFAADRAGSSCHVHLSLWRGDENAFATPDGGESDVFRGFLAGWMQRVPELMPLYAPTVNSYKRFRAASWAPTRIAWSHDNRTAGFRVVGSGSSLRIECRIPGADCNPYLAFAAAIHSGLDGLERGSAPPEPFRGDAYGARDAPLVPATLRDATDAFAASEFARDALGSEAHEHLTRFFRAEREAFDGAVTDWERRRYFERI